MTQIVPYRDSAQATAAGLRLEDVYVTAEYVAADARLLGAEACLYVGGQGATAFGAPFLVRPIPRAEGGAERWKDGVSPYGYPGIIAGQTDPEAILHELELLARVAAAQGLVSLFFRLHPILHAWQLPEHPGIQHSLHGQTVFVELDRPEDRIASAYSSNHRRDLRRLAREGYTVKIDAWDHYEAFQAAYAETMLDRAADTYYLFDAEYFRALRDPALKAHLFTAHKPDGSVASGGVFFAFGETVQYHLGGTRRAERASASSKLVFDAAIRHFRALGHHKLHLGGGFHSADDALFRFKAGFGEGRARFSTLRLQCDPERYAHLLRCREKEPRPVDPGFFPAYRA